MAISGRGYANSAVFAGSGTGVSNDFDRNDLTDPPLTNTPDPIVLFDTLQRAERLYTAGLGPRGNAQVLRNPNLSQQNLSVGVSDVVTGADTILIQRAEFLADGVLEMEHLTAGRH